MQSKKQHDNHLVGSYTSITISIALVILMLGLISILVINAKMLSDKVREHLGFSVILIDDKKEMDIIRLQKELDIADYVLETELVSKEKAAKDLQENLGEDFIGFLGYNPLLASIDVKLKADYANQDSIKSIERQLKKNPLVKEIYYQKSLMGLVNANVKKISFVLFIISFLFFVIAFALINNTIRLSFYAKRFLIKTMQLVGATPSFIRRPFLMKSVLVGVLGSLIAILLMIVAVYFLQKNLEGIVLLSYKWIIFGVMICMGVLITLISSYFSVNRYLSMKSSDLYY